MDVGGGRPGPPCRFWPSAQLLCLPGSTWCSVGQLCPGDLRLLPLSHWEGECRTELAVIIDSLHHQAGPSKHQLWAEECSQGSLEEVSGGGLSSVTLSTTQALRRRPFAFVGCHT